MIDAYWSLVLWNLQSPSVPSHGPGRRRALFNCSNCMILLGEHSGIIIGFLDVFVPLAIIRLLFLWDNANPAVVVISIITEDQKDPGREDCTAEFSHWRCVFRASSRWWSQWSDIWWNRSCNLEAKETTKLYADICFWWQVLAPVPAEKIKASRNSYIWASVFIEDNSAIMCFVSMHAIWLWMLGTQLVELFVFLVSLFLKEKNDIELSFIISRSLDQAWYSSIFSCVEFRFNIDFLWSSLSCTILLFFNTYYMCLV